MQAHTDPTHTKLDSALAAAERRFQNDPERAELIARTRRFKSSWIELAEALSACQKNQHYSRWGYAGFEEYYRKELHLKTSTVNKLVGTYAFLRKTAPEVFDRDGVEVTVYARENRRHLFFKRQGVVLRLFQKFGQTCTACQQFLGRGIKV